MRSNSKHTAKELEGYIYFYIKNRIKYSNIRKDGISFRPSGKNLGEADEEYTSTLLTYLLSKLVECEE